MSRKGKMDPLKPQWSLSWKKKSTWIAERIKPTATSQVRFSSQQKTYTSPPSSERLDDSRQVNKCAGLNTSDRRGVEVSSPTLCFIQVLWDDLISKSAWSSYTTRADTHWQQTQNKTIATAKWVSVITTMRNYFLSMCGVPHLRLQEHIMLTVSNQYWERVYSFVLIFWVERSAHSSHNHLIPVLTQANITQLLYID